MQECRDETEINNHQRIQLSNNALINPLSLNSDQHQLSPNNIHGLSNATSMRINQMITKRKISDLLSISPN